MTPEEEQEFKRRQKGRNLVVGGLLLGLAALFYLITIARM